MKRNRFLAFSLLAVALPLAAGPPAAVAIRGARLVTVSGGIIESGTVVIRDGLIEDAGAGVKIPPGVWVIEGEGLVVYPGLFDALGTIGIPEPPAPAAAAGTRSRTAPAPSLPAAVPPAGGPEDRPLNTSWLRAADLVDPSDRRIETARDAGFTTAAVFPTRGIFAGQGAVINLAGRRAGEMIVASPAGLYLTTSSGGSSGFPGSLMGVLAYIRQVSIDADDYQFAQARYLKQPRGSRRPARDQALEGLLDAPRALLPASRAVEIDRMLRFTAGLRFKPVLYGGQEAYARAEALRGAGVPVLVSLKWPERGRDEDPERIDSLRTLEFRDRAPSTPAALVKAGVKFAFYTEGIPPRELLKNVRRALAAGLAEADALRAFTLAPAEIYGIDDRLGSIEKGKIANLLVTSGPLFAERTRVKYVFVDGVKYEPAPEAPPAAKEAAR